MHWDYLFWTLMGVAHGAWVGWSAAKLHEFERRRPPVSRSVYCPATSGVCDRPCRAANGCGRLLELEKLMRPSKDRRDYRDN